MWYRSIPQRLRQLLRPKRLAIFEACLIGLVSALAAVFLKQGVGWLGGWRVYASHILPAWCVLPIIGLVGGLLSGWLVERIAPEASGSGIPQVKAALAYVPIALNLRVAIVKLVSAIIALGSGLSLGRQGPTVHVGAALAAQLSRWVPTSPDYRQQLIAAGAAAGLAAGFNAPIAGILFVVEELLQDFSRLTLGTAILASFVGGVVSRLLGGHGLNLRLTTSHASLSLQEIPLFLILGALAGLLGALFCKGIFVSLSFNRRVLRLSLPWRVGVAGLASGLIVALLPISLRDNTALQDLLVTGEPTWGVTAIAFVAKFILTLIAYGSGCPGGLFAPSLILGSALGYLVCLCAQSLQTFLEIPPELAIAIGSPTTYALAGMGAFFSAVTRGPITAIVIVFEMTTDFNLVLPLMIGSVISYLVAESISSGSIYRRLLEWNGIYLEEKETATKGLLAQLTAANVMQPRVETLASQMTLDEAMQAFLGSHHRGFPVVDNGKLVGIITQTDLANITEHQLAGKTPLSELMTPRPVTVKAADPLTRVLYLLNHYKISRLPVTEGRKLVGIITRADIIRAESDHLSGKTAQVGPQPEPSYVVYQTRSPAVGRGRLLVPLANPQTAISLLQLAAAVARDRHYELECLQVVIVPRNSSPAETAVKTAKSRRLLRQAEILGRTWEIPVHTQIRVAHDAAQAILETIKERHIDLILMGWKGSTSTPGRIFGNVVDTLIRQAACDVVLVKLGDEVEADIRQAGSALLSLHSPHFNHWLVPLAGGPNAERAVQLLPAFVSLGFDPAVYLCQIFQTTKLVQDTSVLYQAAHFLGSRLRNPVTATPVNAIDVPEAIIELAQKKQCDVIILGASREGLLKQVMHGNIPEAIARNSNCTVILVRGAIPS